MHAHGTIQGCHNRYVNVTFSLTAKTVQCTFLSQTTTDNSRECNATVTYGDNCDQKVGVYASGISSDTVVTTQIQLIDGISEYCLNVTARNGNMTVMVRKGNGEPNHTASLATSLVIVTVLLVLVM